MTLLEGGIKAFKNGEYALAFSILKPYADQGDAEAQCMIASIYHLGLAQEQDGPEALKWYIKSAEQGYPVASNNLGGIYFIGDCGVSPNQQESAKWYRLSREQGFLSDELTDDT